MENFLLGLSLSGVQTAILSQGHSPTTTGKGRDTLLTKSWGSDMSVTGLSVSDQTADVTNTRLHENASRMDWDDRRKGLHPLDRDHSDACAFS